MLDATSNAVDVAAQWRRAPSITCSSQARFAPPSAVFPFSFYRTQRYTMQPTASTIQHTETLCCGITLRTPLQLSAPRPHTIGVPLESHFCQTRGATVATIFARDASSILPNERFGLATARHVHEHPVTPAHLAPEHARLHSRKFVSYGHCATSQPYTLWLPPEPLHCTKSEFSQKCERIFESLKCDYNRPFFKIFHDL